MSRSPLRWALTTAALATVFATSSARADGPGTPTQPPPDPPPGQPPAQVQPGPQVAQSPQQVPSFGTYRRRQQPKSHWYGWQTLIVDGVWIVGSPILAGVGAGEAAGAVGLGAYCLGAPIVHWAHGKVGIGFASLGVRVGAPLVLGTIGLLAGGGGRSVEGGVVGLVVGVFLGMTAAIVLDAAVFSYEKQDEDEDEARARAHQRHALKPASIMPMLEPRTEGGAMFGVSGTLY